MPSLGTSFSTQGATPYNNNAQTVPGAGGDALMSTSSPFAKALANPMPKAQVVTPQASTALKSQTVAPDGSVTHTFHTPTTPGLIQNGTTKTQAPPTTDPVTGLLTDYGKSLQTPPSQPTTTPGLISSSPSSQTPYGSAVSNVGSTSNLGANNINATANQGSQGILNASQNNSAGGQINNLNNTADKNAVLGQNAEDIANAAGQKISDIGGQGARGEAGYLTTGTSPVGEGNAAVLNQSTAAQQQAVSQGANMQLQGNQQAINANANQQSGYNSSGNLALTGQGQAIQGATSAGQLNTGASENAAGVAQTGAVNVANMTAPQAYGLTTQPYNPTTDTYGGGGSGGAIDRSVLASNIGSAGEFQSKIQATQAQASAADANFDVLNNYAQGFAGNSPIVNGLSQKYGTSVEGNQAVAGFQAQLQTLRQAWTNIIGGDATQAIPDNVTPDQLKEKQQALKTAASNNVAGYQQQLNGLKGSNSSSTSSSGGSYTSSTGNSYKLPY